MSLISYKRGQGSIILRIKVLDSAATTGAGKTGLTNASAGLIISAIADNEAVATPYTQAAGNIETIVTLGTFAAPTAGKCRFKELDATNHKGCYEIQLADARYAVSGAKSLLVSLGGAAGASETDAVIPLQDLDPYDAIRAGLTALPPVNSGGAGSIPTTGIGANQISVAAGAVTVGTNNDKTNYGIDQSAAVPTSPAAGTIGDALRRAITDLDVVLSTRMASGNVTVVTNLDKAGYGIDLTGAVPASPAAGTIGESLRRILADIDVVLSTRMASGNVTAVTVLDKTGYQIDPAQTIPASPSAGTLGLALRLILNDIDATISSRLASGPVTVGTNNDKSSYGIDLGIAIPASPGAATLGLALRYVLDRLDAAITSRQPSGNVTVSTNLDKTGYGIDLAGAVPASPAADTIALALRRVLDRLDALITSRPTAAQVNAEFVADHGAGLWTRNTEPDNTGIDLIEAIAGRLDTTLEQIGATGAYRLKAGALTQVPAYPSVPTTGDINAALEAVHGVGLWTRNTEPDNAGIDALEVIVGRLDTALEQIGATEAYRFKPGALTQVPAYPTVPTTTEITTALTADHGAGSWARNTEPDNAGINAIEVIVGRLDTILEQINTSGNYRLKAAALDQVPDYPAAPTTAEIGAALTSDHGTGLWTRNTEPDNAGVANILSVSNKHNSMLALDGGGVNYRYTAAALALAPTGGGTGGAGASAAEIDDLLSVNHGAGLWTRNTEPDNAGIDAIEAIIGRIDTALEQINVSGTYRWKAAALTQVPAYPSVPTTAQIDAALVAAHGAGSWTRNTEPDNTAIALILQTSNHIDTMIELDGTGTAYRYTTGALARAPTGAGGGGATAAEIAAVLTTDHGAGLWTRNTEPDNANVGVIAETANRLAGLLQSAAPGPGDQFTAQALALAPTGAGGAGGGATAEGIDALLSDRHGAGAWGPGADMPGAVPVDHNFGGTDNFRLTYLGSGVANVTISAYDRADFDAGRTGSMYLVDRVLTNQDGRWARPMVLSPGDYTIVAAKENSFKPVVSNITVL